MTGRVLALVLLAVASLVIGCSQIGVGQDPPLPDDSGLELPPQPNPRAPVQACPVEGVADIAFLVPPGTEVVEWVPGLSGATELDGHDGSLVVMYAGVAYLPNLTGIPEATRDPTMSGVVCVVTPGGEPNVYTDVSRTGVRIPPGVEPPETWTDDRICELFAQAPTC